MNCPICAAAELELVQGKKSLKGILVKPDILTCPKCGMKAEQKQGKLRFLHVPAPYVTFMGNNLVGWISSSTINKQGKQARDFLYHSQQLAANTQSPCEVDFALHSNETCIYKSIGVLQQQRTKQNQPYWAEVEQGPVVLTTKYIYVNSKKIPLNKIQTVINVNKQHINIVRVDRKHPQRITFPNWQFRHLFLVSLAAHIPEATHVPSLGTQPFRQKSSAFKLSIPIGKRHINLPPIAIPLIPVLILCLVFCGLGNFGNSNDETVMTPTQTTRNRTINLTSTNTAEPVFTPTYTSIPVEETATNTATPIQSTTVATASKVQPTIDPDCWQSTYLADVTIPDGTYIQPNTTFDKVWRVRNSGTCIWQDVTLEYASGVQMEGIPVAVTEISQGEETEVSVSLTAPATIGQAKAMWRFKAGDVTFGTLTVMINVGSPPTQAPPPTNTPVTVLPTPTTAAAPAAVCDCSGDLYNCSSFSTHNAAQACFNYCRSIGRGDIHRLDRDNDGIACESLP